MKKSNPQGITLFTLSLFLIGFSFGLTGCGTAGTAPADQPQSQLLTSRPASASSPEQTPSSSLETVPPPPSSVPATAETTLPDQTTRKYEPV
ncbi:hypothetical protein [Desulfitobacterium chlororespirans]|uniref:hypothetical protein n=1 Tax=Desulfitobacterium chlororespirans TaxID=51616 RepID=UPI001160A3A2|nr:hypothetical protein [Desulfitobacterium chlororespirans]